MTEIWFYHLEKKALDDVLPGLVERALARGWRVLIRTDSAERAQMLDSLLWTWSEDSFLPHAQMGDGEPREQPVLITPEDGNPNGAAMMLFVGGALPAGFDETACARIAVLFDGRDASAVAAARGAWSAAKGSGHTVAYWKQSGGKWEKHA